MKNFLTIMKVCLVLLVIEIAVPAVTSFFDAGSYEQIMAGVSMCGLAILPVAGKLETIVDVKERRSQIHEYLNALNDRAKEEKRDLTSEEQTEWQKYDKEFRDLGEKLKKLEADEKRQMEMMNPGKLNNQEREKRDISKYNFLKAIKQQVEGRLDGLEAEMHQEAAKEIRESGGNLTGFGVPNIVIGTKVAEMRAMTATGQTSAAGDQGGMLIETTKEGLIMALRPKLVLASLGAKTIGGLIVGNIDRTRGTSTTVAWEGENDDNADTSIATSSVTLSPKRLGASSVISKQLLLQTSKSLELTVLDDIFKAIAQAVEIAAINGGSGQPTGILNTTGIGSVAGGTNGAAPTLAHLINLATEVAMDNADMGSLGYLTNPKVRGKLQQTVIETGSGIMTWDFRTPNDVAGYKAGVSTLVPSTLTKGSASAICSAILFGDFSALEILNWGGMDVVVDPYSLKKKGQIELAVNSWWDVFVKHPAAFAAMVDALT